MLQYSLDNSRWIYNAMDNIDPPLPKIGLNLVCRFHKNIPFFTFSVIVDADPSGNSCHYANFLVGGTTGLYIKDCNF